MEIEYPKRSLKELLNFSIINVDKPAGPTSFQVVEKIAKMLGVKKASHFGTLDPMVTGVLPVALGKAVRLTGYFMGHDKEYIGTAHLHSDIELEKIKKTIKEKFLGTIVQLPPVRSRVRREERKRQITKFEILEKEEKDILYHVECQAGTYIRKLIHDLGKELGTGANMTELRRIRAGIFSEENSVTLYEISKIIEEKEENKLKEILHPVEIISKVLACAVIRPERKFHIINGIPIKKSDIIKADKIKIGEEYAVYCDNFLIGIFERTEKNFGKAKTVFKE